MNTQIPVVNFYILPDSDFDKRHFFVYRLVEKSLERNLKTVIIGADEAHVQTLDRLLWTVKPERFIAHDVLDGQTQPVATIVLTSQVSNISAVNFQPEVVIDLGYDGTPLNFPKIMLVANQHAEILANARMKYQSYVNQGITPEIHKISDKQLT